MRDEKCWLAESYCQTSWLSTKKDKEITQVQQKLALRGQKSIGTRAPHRWRK